MRRATPVLLAAALALGGVAAHEGDLAEHPCYDTEADALDYPQQQVFFEEGDSKVGNAADSPHPWGTEEPTSVTGGSGAGQLSLSSQADGTETVTTFEGTFDGCIDTLLLDLYSFDPANRSSTAADGEPNAHTLTMSIDVDGLTVFSGTEVTTNTTYGNEAMGPNLNQVAIDLSDTLEQFAASENIDFDLTGEHTVTVRVAPYFINTGSAVVYTWDAAETPSGITFNGEVTDDYALGN